MRKVLIVDDSAINRKILKEMLSPQYQVVEAVDGEEALEILQRDYSGISAVLLDIVMPVMDGYDVLKRIRSDSRFKMLPVIMITASDDESTRVKSLELSANDYVRKPYSPEILLHCLQNNIALCEADAQRKKAHNTKKKKSTVSPFSLRATAIVACIVSLALSLCFQHIDVQNELRITSENVAVDFTEIMYSYQHSFKLFELLIQEQIEHAQSVDELENFLKTHDKPLLDIEGGDYDGVYMYYKGRYLYSWDTPYSVYAESGYDATKRPWYIGAVEAKGELYFSIPYPSYANDYMLATISRLQDDGESVIAYDIKLGAISEYVNRLNLYEGSLALICDMDGNIIGSTNPSYLGGNHTFTDEQLSHTVDLARQQVENSDPKAQEALASAEAQQKFVTSNREYIEKMLSNKSTLIYSPSDYSYGFSYANDEYICFVITPMAALLPQIIVLWAAISFGIILAVILLDRMVRRNHLILNDVLTGLSNRRAFMKYCDNHILHHSDENLGLIMLDLNHFKKINDMYGHTVGDRALIDASAVLKSACADSDGDYFLCRYGGDEFLLAARVKDIMALENMRVIITDTFSRKNQTSMTPYVLSASIGTACGLCKDKKDMETLLKLADQAMYEEKRKSVLNDA